MAEIVTTTQLLVSTVTATSSSASATASSGAPPQGGILEGENPSKYDPKVSLSVTKCFHQYSSSRRTESNYLVYHPSRDYHYFLPLTSLPIVSDPAASCDRRSDRRHFTRPVRDGTDSRIYKCHIPHCFHAEPEPGRKPWFDSFPFLGRLRSRFEIFRQQLEDRSKRRHGRNGIAVWTGICHRLGPVQSIQYRG